MVPAELSARDTGTDDWVCLECEEAGEPDEDGRRLSVPVVAAEGLTTRVVRALDRAGVPVNDVTMQRASLDDVFLSLTGHVTAPAEDTSDDEEGSVAA